LAERLQVERSTIVRWEAGDTEPQPWQRPRIAEALTITLAELDSLLDSVTEVPGRADGYTLVSSVPLDFSLTPSHTVQIMEGFSGHDLAARRHVLAELALFSGAALLRPVRAWAAAVPTVPLAPRGVGAEELGELERAVQVFRRWDASGGGGLRRKAVVGQLNAITEM